MTADVFIVTQAGLDASTDAANGGITLRLTTFKVGSAYGYNPTKADTALHGSLLYSDNITSFATAGDGSLIVNCTIAVSAGPFDFGEVGIYTESGALFALMALPQLEHKYSSLGSNVASTFTFQAYLRLGQAGGVIEIVTGGGGGGGGGTSNFVYTPQSGQPPGLWGSTDGGVNSFVWNPSNFNVSTAKNIVNPGAATYAGSTHTFYAADGTTHLADLSGAGVFTVANLAITSDMRYKYDVQSINDGDALKVVLGMHGITYSLMAGSDMRYPGISAQELQALFPAGVQEDEKGKLSVLYPQVAGALFPAALRAALAETETELSILRKEIAELRAAINAPKD